MGVNKKSGEHLKIISSSRPMKLNVMIADFVEMDANWPKGVDIFQFSPARSES